MSAWSAYLPWLELAGVVLLLLPLPLVGRVPLAYNLRNLTVRWPITALTALAFTIVVGLLTVMLAFVNGMDRLTQGSGRPGNVLVLSEGATDELFSTLSRDDTGDVAREPGIQRDEGGTPLCSRELYVVVNQAIPPGPGERHERRRFIQVRGIEDPRISLRVHGLELYPGGTTFSGAGVRSVGAGRLDAIEAILGEGVARELAGERGKERLDVGDVFELGPRQWVVTGVMKSGGSTFNSEVWAKGQKVGDQFGKQNVYSSIVLRTPDAGTAQELSERLKKYKKVRLEAQPETEYYAKLSEASQQLLYFIYFVAVIMAMGGVFGVMITMFAAISQRIGDIGVLRILGFARWQVLVSFLLETLVIALVGGVLGCALGYLADGRTATSVVSNGQGGGKSVVLKLVVDGNIIAVGLLFTLVMGLVGGLAPALWAMFQKPLRALH